jgi:predicted metal-dependent phosphoesterase TrpH
VGGAVDLHSHTTASDGTLGPRELVRLAARHGVRVLAVTDHDSTGGIAQAMDEAKQLSLEIVPGLEINCDVPGAEIHVLGYCLDWEAPWFQEFLGAQREERRQRIYRIAERLAALGVPIDPEAVFALVKDGSAGRPHVAQAMVDRGYVKSVREAFDRYLSLNGPANVPRKRLTPVEAVRVIRRARGVPVLAHPGLAHRDEVIPELIQAGLLGLEAFYPEHSAGQITAYREMCSRLGLIATGGSDFHGPRVGGVRHPGAQPVPEGVWHELRDRLARLGAESPSAPPPGSTAR